VLLQKLETQHRPENERDPVLAPGMLCGLLPVCPW